jgi:Flp pilus assembly pilin Flp
MKLLRNISQSLKALHRDEQGADMIEYILIVAAIALPLLGVIIWFWKDISAWVKESYDEAKTGDGTNPDDL